MKFDKFLRTLDMGECEDQMQREALLDLALLFMVIDDEIEATEEAVIHEWLTQIQWSAEVSVLDFYRNSLVKAQKAVNGDDVEHFIAHRVNLLIDDDMKATALQLADAIINADGILDDKEKYALTTLQSYLNSGE